MLWLAVALNESAQPHYGTREWARTYDAVPFVLSLRLTLRLFLTEWMNLPWPASSGVSEDECLVETAASGTTGCEMDLLCMRWFGLPGTSWGVDGESILRGIELAEEEACWLIVGRFMR